MLVADAIRQRSRRVHSIKIEKRQYCLDNIVNLDKVNIANFIVNFYKFGKLVRLDLYCLYA